MGKKNKAKKNRDNKPQVVEKKPKKHFLWVTVAILAIISVAAVYGSGLFSDSGNKDAEVEREGRSFNLEGKETRPVLDPSQFVGQVRAAYAAAKKYPEILNEVFCYCFCERPPFNHKTLLSCFTNKHGAG